MRPPEDVARRLSRDWLAKAATDLLVCERLLGVEVDARYRTRGSTAGSLGCT
jgi:hypothetical protein